MGPEGGDGLPERHLPAFRSVTEVRGVISATDLAARLDGLDAVGVGPSGAVNRLAWTAEDEATGAWFAAQAAAGGLRVHRDAAGNRWALPDGDGPWWVVGSHLDSVR